MEIKKNIKYVGVIDWDRRLFDELIPLPEGTSYNSYFIKGNEKNALIDTVDPSKEKQYLRKLSELEDEKIDYIISHHAEQDHSGLIPKILELHPEAKVVTNNKCKLILQDLMKISDEKFITVEDGEEISLGDKTLKFIFTPWVHWPETMITYLKEDKILFSCDFLGSHYAPTKLFVEEDPIVYYSAKRYYSEIMMPFRNNIKKHLKKIEELDIDIIAPSHGPIYLKPEFILNAYRDWISDDVKNQVIIPYISMHGSTKRAVEHLTDVLEERGVEVKLYNLTKTDIGELAMSLVDAATIIVATPTVLLGPHPNVLYAVYLANMLRPKTKFASFIITYGWGGKALDQLSGMVNFLKVEVIDPVIIKGHPKDEDLKSIETLADKVVEKHKSLGLL